MIMAALNMTIANRNPQPGRIHHSDQERPYAATAYRQRLMSISVPQSMSRKGNCWDTQSIILRNIVSV
ncbi:MAG: transposase InsO family protein [Candidatus Azotimanducaceae bacterium]|jgi:transposase InsO family protein